MSWWMIVLIGLLLGWVTIQDFRERQVSLVALGVLFGLGIISTCLALPWQELPYRVMYNSVFGSIILVSGALLVKIRKPEDPVSAFIGIGDFLFLLSISPLFSFGSYLVFLNTSMILVLFSYGCFLLIGLARSNSTVPLAGALSLCLMCTLVLDRVVAPDLFEEVEWVLNLLG